MFRKIAATVCVLLLFTAAEGAFQPSDPTLTLLRMLNTLQSEGHRLRGSYSPLPELVANDALKPIDIEVEVLSDGTARFRDQVVTLTLDDGHNHYQIAVVPLARCARAWFTSDRGLIFTGQALGCSEK